MGIIVVVAEVVEAMREHTGHEIELVTYCKDYRVWIKDWDTHEILWSVTPYSKHNSIYDAYMAWCAENNVTPISFDEVTPGDDLAGVFGKLWSGVQRARGLNDD